MLQLTDPQSNRYPGGKGAAGHADWIVARMATHAHYAEPFAGKAAVFRRKQPAMTSILLDLNPAVVDWHRLRNWPSTDALELDGIWWMWRRAEELDEDWLIYCDPPYVRETRTKRAVYGRLEWDDQTHEKFLRQANDLRCRLMVSGYSCPMYEEYLSDWHREAREVMTRGGLRTDCLWMNYNPRRVVRDTPRMPGKNWRERQRIARKVRRQRLLFSQLPDYEQDALLRGLLEERRRARRGRGGSTHAGGDAGGSPHHRTPPATR